MTKRLLVAGLVVGTILAGISPTAFAKSPVTATGTITCGFDGIVKFKPPLLFGGTSPVVATYKGALSGCSGAHTPSGITGGKVQGVFSLASNDCQTDLFQGAVYDADMTGMPTFTSKWKGKPPVLLSTVSVIPLFSGAPIGGISSSFFQVGGLFDTETQTGSFIDGGLANVYGAFSNNFREMLARCSPKSSGNPIGGGMKKEPFSAAAGSTVSF